MNNWVIYEHISPSGKIYVGITSKEVQDRWRYGSGYKNCIIFQKAINKYGWNNFNHRVIAFNLGEMTAKNMERDLIAFNKSKGISYNITDGGEGHLGCSWTPSEKTKALWSKQRRGKIIPVEQRRKISESMKNNPYRISEESHLKSSEVLKKKLSRRVLQLDLEGNAIKEWPSIKEAARTLNICDRDIIRVCKGERKTRGGYVWKYINI